jgi:hypothetical protein
VEDITSMMRVDALSTAATTAHIMWWVDVACSNVDRTTAEDLVVKFGLPNDSKFLSSFGNFGNVLPADPKCRMFAGSGNHTSGKVFSLNYFVQSLWMRNVPVVHHLPPWLRACQMGTCGSTFIEKMLAWAANYYSSRFAFLANLSWLSYTQRDEKIGAYQSAESLAKVLTVMSFIGCYYFVFSLGSFLKRKTFFCI